ncbi:hypothetical protein [Actinotalea sp.]|uniref:hypothetical protein n=1 Tax=Actinotalea sp. TaxID=1872145 RepID=UPI003562E126
MSSGRLSATRDALAAALAGLGTVHAVMPSRLTPPAVVLEQADPWVTTADQPNRFGLMRYQVTLTVRPGANPDQEQALTDMVEDALDALAGPHDWTVQQVSAPLNLQVGEAVYLAARLDVTAPTYLTTD